MRRLLCEKNFDNTIAYAAKMNFEDLNKHLEEIKRSDLEVKNKLKLLGVADHRAEEEMKQLIDQQQQPKFRLLAKTFRAGKFAITLKIFSIWNNF